MGVFFVSFLEDFDFVSCFLFCLKAGEREKRKNMKTGSRDVRRSCEELQEGEESKYIAC